MPHTKADSGKQYSEKWHWGLKSQEKFQLSQLLRNCTLDVPLLCGHNVQALSILTHESAQRKEILQMQEGTAFSDDMTNYLIHTFWLLAPVRMIFLKLHRIVVLYSDLEQGRGPHSYRCQLNHGDCDWIGELWENSLSKNPIARAHYVPTNAHKYNSYKVSNFRFCDVHFF